MRHFYIKSVRYSVQHLSNDLYDKVMHHVTHRYVHKDFPNFVILPADSNAILGKLSVTTPRLQRPLFFKMTFRIFPTW